jgi:protein-disulfide isomerase
MSLSKNTPARGLILVGLFAMALASGCNKPKRKHAPAPATSGSAGVAAAVAPTGPCQKYAAALCDKAGKESETCQQLTAVSDILSPSACNAGMKDIAYSVKKLGEANKSCEDLVGKLCGAIGPTSETCNMVKTQTKTFPASRCKQMLEHIPEITADLKKMEAANQPLSAELAANIAKGKVPSFGPEDAKVTVVEFSDFQCPYCSRAASAVDEIKKKYGDRVRFVFRQFPLPMHENARGAAEAALAANAQGKFWEFHDMMFQNQGKLTRDSLEDLAKQAGLNVPEFKKALDSKAYSADVDSDVKLGESVAVNGTPTMFINGARVQNPTSFEAIAQQIDGALSGKPAAAHAGTPG